MMRNKLKLSHEKAREEGRKKGEKRSAGARCKIITSVSAQRKLNAQKAKQVERSGLQTLAAVRETGRGVCKQGGRAAGQQTVVRRVRAKFSAALADGILIRRARVF